MFNVFNLFSDRLVVALRPTPRDLAMIAMFTALMAVLALPPGISFGGITPITLQTLGFMLAATLLRFPWGAAAVALYVLLIVIGLPIAAGGRGGPAVITGPTGGYLLGAIIGAGVTGLLVDRWLRRRASIRVWQIVVANVIGLMVVVYAVGIPWSAWRTGSGLFALMTNAVQFLPGDVVKVAITAAVSSTVIRAYPPIAARP